MFPRSLWPADLVAIPDFAAGAMENWGLCTFRLTSLLYDSASSSSALKEWVTQVVAHELAHQVSRCTAPLGEAESGEAGDGADGVVGAV